MTRKIIGLFIAISMFASMSGQLFAGCNQMMGGECGNCAKSGAMTDPWRKFQGDTIDLRQVMMMKRFELQRENLKPVQDLNKVAQLQAEVKTLQGKIHDIRTASGLPVDKCDGECGEATRNCGKKGPGGCDGKPCNKAM